MVPSASSSEHVWTTRGSLPLTTMWGRIVAMVVNAGLLNEIAKMIVDGAVHDPVSRLPIVHFCVGKVKPVIDSVYKFDDVYSAYDKLMTRHARGKVVIEVA